MPWYSYRCRECREVTEAIRSVAEHDQCPSCKCGGQTKQIIAAQYVVPDLEPYYDDNLQSHIKSKQHRRRVMQEQGVAEKFGKGWT